MHWVSRWGSGDAAQLRNALHSLSIVQEIGYDHNS